MGRFEIALGKKAPKSKSKPAENPTLQTSMGPQSMNFFLNGPGGFRIIIPLRNLNCSYKDHALTIQEGAVSIRIMGPIGKQMWDDIQAASHRYGENLTDPYRRRPRPYPQ